LCCDESGYAAHGKWLGFIISERDNDETRHVKLKVQKQWFPPSLRHDYGGSAGFAARALRRQ
jgi:hypothetical protein